MSNDTKTSVGIVGAGSMGIVTGYDLARAGADITYLVRPHRAEHLARPQVLYSYDDHTRKQFSDYKVITDPAALSDHEFDYLVVTLDGASLRSEAGLTLVEEIGRAYRGTTTGVLLGTAGLGVRDWFLEKTGLDQNQVLLATPGALIYEVQKADIPLGEGVDADLIEGADYAYRHLSPAGFVIDRSAPQLADKITSLYSGDEIPGATSLDPVDFELQYAAFPVIAAWEMLGWPALTEVDADNDTWKLGVGAMREIQNLPTFGQAGKDASAPVTPGGVLESFRQMSGVSEPLNFAAFNAYHHGGKVNNQDHALLRDALGRGETAGVEMPALRALVAKLPHAQA